MEKKEMSSKDLLLCFLYSSGQTNKANEPIVGRTKITKMMFLFEKEIYGKFFKDDIQIELPEYEAYYFGPFSKQLFDDLSFFLAIGMIEAENTGIPLSSAGKVEAEEASNDDLDEFDDEDDTSFKNNETEYEISYSLGESGLSYVEEKIWNLLSSAQKEKLKAFKAQINRISLDALLRYVYNKYPDTTVNSKIADKYLKKDND